MANAIGIDFGTTKTMVSYFNPATGRVELVRLGRDKDSIPTTVHVDKTGEFLFGDDADDLIETDPEGYCRAFKTYLGENEVVLPRSDRTAEALTVKFLQHIKDECEQSVFHREPVTYATITIPVSFSPARQASLKRAAESAGFTKVSFLLEPEAAGIAFLHDNPKDKFSRALVLDWGGGTLDIAIISRGDAGRICADRHCAEGCEGMGGEEIDISLLKNMAEMWKESSGAPLIQDKSEEVRFLRTAQKIKERLSKKDVVSFRRGTRKEEITRDRFKHIISDFLEEAVGLVASALAKNKAQGNPEPDALILIGGSCKIPAVHEAMEQNFPNLRVLSWHHSHEAVALGAMEVCKTGDAGSQHGLGARKDAKVPPPVPEAFRREVVSQSGLGARKDANVPPPVPEAYRREEVCQNDRHEKEAFAHADQFDKALWRRIVAIIVERLGVDQCQIDHNSNIVDDLGADSLDVVELVMAFEEEFGVSIPEEEAVRLTTAGAVYQYLRASRAR